MFWLLNEGIPINDKCKWARNKDDNLFNFIFEFLVEKNSRKFHDERWWRKLRKSWPVNSIVGCLLRRPYAFGAAIWPPPPDWTVSVCTASVVSSNAGCLSVHASRPTGTERVGCTYHTNISLKKWWLFICNILGLFFFYQLFIWLKMHIHVDSPLCKENSQWRTLFYQKWKRLLKLYSYNVIVSYRYRAVFIT